MSNPQWQYNPLAIPLGISVALILLLTVLGLRQRSTPVKSLYLAFMGCLLFWVGFSLLELITLNLKLSLLFADLSFIGITFFSLIWLGLIMIFTGRRAEYLRWLPWLLAIPILTNLVIWTNSLHGMWRGASYRDLALTWFPVSFYEYGPWFYVIHVPYQILLTVYSLSLLIVFLLSPKKAYHRQATAMLISFLFPFTIAVLDLFGLELIPYFNASVLVFPLSALLIGWSILDLEFMDLTPIARDTMLENMMDLVITVDVKGRVVDVNPSAEYYLFDNRRNLIGKPFEALISPSNIALAELFENRAEMIGGAHTYKEVEIKGPDGLRIYEVLFSSITYSTGELAGQLMVLRDITMRKRAEQAIVAQGQRVAIMEERQRVARELHDSVNQTLFAAGTFADLLPRAAEKKPEKVVEYAQNIQQLLHGATAEMRLVLLELYPDALEQSDLGTVLRQTCAAFTGMASTEVDIQVSPQLYLEKAAHVAIYRITREALNNIYRHTEATEVAVSLICDGRDFTLLIRDNGPGFDVGKLKPAHFGLVNMRQRAEVIGARLTIDSQIGKGTTLKVERKTDD